MDHLYTVNDQFGFPTQVMVTMLPPAEAVSGPAVNEMFEVDLLGYWYDGQQWQSVGPKPGEFYVMDKLNKTWIPNYEQLTQQLDRLLDKERARRNQYAVEVNSIMFDGDNTAQTNLKNKIEEVRGRLALGIAMPSELLVWRDINNQTHSWTDINNYYQFLQSYAIALAERGTRLYIKMWQHKAAIQALIDSNTAVEQIQLYPIEQDWD